MWAFSPAELLLSSVLENLLALLYLMFSLTTCVPPASLDTISVFLPLFRDWERTGQGKCFLWPGYWPFCPTVQLMHGVKPLPCCFSLGKPHSLSPPSGIPWCSRRKYTAEVQTHGKWGPVLVQADASRERLALQVGTYVRVPHRVRCARARSALTSYTPLRSHSP